MLRFDRKQQNSVKQLSLNKKEINLKKIQTSCSGGSFSTPIKSTHRRYPLKLFWGVTVVQGPDLM